MPEASPSPVIAKPLAGKTFRVSLWIIAGLAAVQIAAIAFAVVRNDLGNRSLEERRPQTRLVSNLTSTTSAPAGFPPLDDMFRQEGMRDLAPAKPIEFERTTKDTVTDPVAREHFTMAKLQRKRGDIQSALENFIEADKALPQNAEILYQIASCFDALDLPEKATDTWVQIHQLGPELAGEFYTIASLKLIGSEDGAAARFSVVTLGKTQLSEMAEETSGQMVNLRAAIRAEPGAVIDPQAVHLRVLFFDLINGRTIARGAREDDYPRRLVTEPINWEETSDEIIDVAYFRSYTEGVKPGEDRQFYGFVAELYYDDVLQDIVAQPRILIEEQRNLEKLAPVSLPDGSRVDSSLFPRG